MRGLFLSFFLVVTIANGAGSTLTLLAVGAFGAPLTSCSVEHFRSDDEHGSPRDYADHFRGLVGLDIPAGEYEAFLRCDEDVAHKHITVERADQVAVVARKENLINGERGNPKLMIALDGAPPAGESWWVRLLGLYNEKTDSSKFSGDHAALDAPDAGSYIVAVLSAGGYECIRQIDVFEQTRRWTFHRASCSFDLDRYAHLVDASATVNRKSGWYLEMQKDREEFLRQLQEAADKK